MIARKVLWEASQAVRIPIAVRRRHSTSWQEGRLAERVQSYVSKSRDPYLNLAIEQHFLQKSDPESTLLLLYINKPSVVIGRNQNPWLEVNLAQLDPAQRHPEKGSALSGPVELIRRRSGGGTVFHDEGNVNWSVICPSTTFTRDKHAEMVVRALRDCGIERARVNERHDIVLDQGERQQDSDPDDTHFTPCTTSKEDGPRPLKVSGSAYKLTRGRAMHHGTCLLSSPNLDKISSFLRSPAKPFIQAKGVESVSSPVTNINLNTADFIAAVQEQYGQMYLDKEISTSIELDSGMLDVPEIKAEYEEIQTLDWKFLQTPQFTLSNAAEQVKLAEITLTVRHGIINEATIVPSYHRDRAPVQALANALQGERLHGLGNPEYARAWFQKHSLDEDAFAADEAVAYALRWLEKMVLMRSNVTSLA